MSSLHESAVVVDGHNDFILLLNEQVDKDRFLLRPPANHLGERWIPEFRRGGVDVVVAPIFILHADEGALRRTLLLLDLIHRQVERNRDDAAICATGAEIDAAVAQGRVALLLALEGFDAVGRDPELVGTFHRLGVRMASFSHFGRTFLADGSREDATGSRLTSIGVEVLGEMERLGMVMDISHLSLSCTEHVLEIATRPLVASHSSARALCEIHRNLTDEHIRGVAATGGVVGVNFFAAFVDHAEPTVDRLVDHIEHVVEVAGVDHVGLGPDFVRDLLDHQYPQDDRLIIEGVDAKMTLRGLARASDMPIVTDTLVERGFADVDVRKILGGNLLRVFNEVVGVPAAATGVEGSRL